MDDNLEQPTTAPARDPTADGYEEESGEEDEGPDWTKLASAPKPSLPKRGDKEFEPAADGPTDLQAHSLNRARNAMFGALAAERGTSNKSVSYAVWYPELARAHVTQARGVLFNGMGHSVARGTNVKVHKRTELLPEETLYLIERGGLFCWKRDAAVPQSQDIEEDDMQGSPMSVQQAFAEMIGTGDLTLERYHAYAYLKRLGFNVLRSKPPSSAYPTPPPLLSKTPAPYSLLMKPFFIFSRIWRRIFGRINWWKPLSIGWLGCAPNYASVYRLLRLVPSGHGVPLSISSPKPPSDEPPTPYEIFYNVYKPNTPFKKSAPPAPDFSLAVVDARTTPLPTIQELTHLWTFVPETGPPPPRQRNRGKPPVNANAQPKPPPSPPPTFFQRLFRFTQTQEKPQPPRKPHPFAVLKSGKKTVVVGVVDSGTVSFFRFGMGAFEEMPMM